MNQQHTNEATQPETLETLEATNLERVTGGCGACNGHDCPSPKQPPLGGSLGGQVGGAP